MSIDSNSNLIDEELMKFDKIYSYNIIDDFFIYFYDDCFIVKSSTIFRIYRYEYLFDIIKTDDKILIRTKNIADNELVTRYINNFIGNKNCNINYMFELISSKISLYYIKQQKNKRCTNDNLFEMKNAVTDISKNVCFSVGSNEYNNAKSDFELNTK